MDHPDVDYVIRGDGDAALPMLAKALRDDSSLDAIPGLVRRRQNGTLEIKPPAVNGTLDALPVPAFDLISWKYYQRSGKGQSGSVRNPGLPPAVHLLCGQRGDLSWVQATQRDIRAIRIGRCLRILSHGVLSILRMNT